MWTLQQISALVVVGECVGALLWGDVGIGFCSTERRNLRQRKRRKKKKTRIVKCMVCICRRGEECFVIQNSDCNEWFHGEYVQVTEQDSDQIKDYFCATCWTVLLTNHYDIFLVSLVAYSQYSSCQSGKLV